MMEIKLTRGLVALVDDEDFENVAKYNWVPKTVTNCLIYAQANVNGKLIKLHQFIMKSKYIDHLNHNGLDNRKINLRVASQRENTLNNRVKSNNRSGKTGVSWDHSRNKWVAQITVNYKNIHLGRFKKFNDAVKKREEAELNYFGKLSSNKKQNTIKLENTTPRYSYRKPYSGKNKYKGVNFVNKRYRVRLLINNKRTYIGHFDNEIDAAKCYIQAYKKLYGKVPYEL